MKIIKTELIIKDGNKVNLPSNNKYLNYLRQILLTFFYLFKAKILKTPGINIHIKSIKIALNGFISKSFSRDTIFNLVTFPMDSVRYFELNFFYNIIKEKHFNNYLDISSPRLLPLITIKNNKVSKVTILNPDINDLSTTKTLFKNLKNMSIEYQNNLIEDFVHENNYFDLITCLSVLEHIPNQGDKLAIKHIWNLLKSGGTIIISVPCAKEYQEEHINLNEYNLQETEKDGFVFGQKFYDKKTLEECFFSIMGSPSKIKIFGELKEGLFIKNRNDKLSSINYPFWKESFVVGSEYKYFNDIDDLPGWGVICMSFTKK